MGAKPAEALRLEEAWRMVGPTLRAILDTSAPQPGSPGLAAEAKLALIHLVLGAEGVERSVLANCAAVGAGIGSSTDRSGRRALEALKDRGYIDVPDAFKGRLTVYINDPLKVARARLGPAAGVNEQGELEFSEPANSPREEPGAPAGVLRLPPAAAAAGLVQDPPLDPSQDPPAGLAQDPPFPHKTSLPRKDVNPTSNISHPRATSQDVGWADGGSRTRPAAGNAAAAGASPGMSRLDARAFTRMVGEAQRSGRPTPEPLPIGGLIAGIVSERVSAEGRALRVRDLVAWMHKAVGPGLARNADGSVSRGGEEKLERIAWAVADGTLPERKLYALVEALNRCERSGALRTSRPEFFLGSMRAEFGRCGLAWKDKPAAPAAAPAEERAPS